MEAKEKVVIFDIDGTLAHMNGRIARHGKRAAPFIDTDAHDDDVDEEVLEALQLYQTKYKIIICSGRKDDSRKVAEEWLKDNGINYEHFFMRKSGDNRKDSFVKEDIYNENIKPLYDVRVVFDDRNQVVDMWRNVLGLKCFQVAEGNF